MSAAPPSTARSASHSPALDAAGGTPTPLDSAAARRWAAELGDEHTPATEEPPASRFAWCVTGSGHYLEESLALALRLPNVDLYLSGAADEVLPLYGWSLVALRERFRVFRDKSASSVPVGRLYAEAYHTVVIAPATSNTVAKCVVGISDTLPTNMFAQAGKLGVPSLVFACDTEPVVVTKAPRSHAQAWLTLRPRRIELESVERLRGFEHCSVVDTPAALEAALDARLAALKLAWNASSS